MVILYGGYPFWIFFSKFFYAILMYFLAISVVQIFMTIGETVLEIYTVQQTLKWVTLYGGYPFWTFFSKIFYTVLFCILTVVTVQIFVTIHRSVWEVYSDKKKRVIKKRCFLRLTLLWSNITRLKSFRSYGVVQQSCTGVLWHHFRRRYYEKKVRSQKVIPEKLKYFFFFFILGPKIPKKKIPR